MRTFALLFLGVVVGWAASGVNWSREAVGQEEAGEPVLNDLQRRVDDIQRSNRQATQRIVGSGTVEGDRLEITGPAISASYPGRYSLKVQASNGYYVIDSLTGRVWYGSGANRPQLIAAELPEK